LGGVRAASLLKQALDRHEELRSRSLSLIPSENVMSPEARRLLSADLAHRYTSLKPRPLHGQPVEDYYMGTRWSREVIRVCEDAARSLFKCGYADVSLISGHIADLAMVAGVCKHGDKIAVVEPLSGGYPGFQREKIPSLLGVDVVYLPTKSYTPVAEEAASIVRREKPKLVVLGGSIILFPHPVRELAEACSEVGAVLAYDGSHVLGLIAGGEFQLPLDEGAHLLAGSTHKTLPGPQGGILLASSRELGEQVSEHIPHKLVDNPHLHRIAALAYTLAEMLEYSKSYARQVVSNARALARALDESGVPVLFRELGYTCSHQVKLEVTEDYLEKAKRLEQAHLIIDLGGRLGTQELTRRGMKEKEMEKVAELFSRVWRGEPPEKVRREVMELSAEFSKVYYSLEEGLP